MCTNATHHQKTPGYNATIHETHHYCAYGMNDKPHPRAIGHEEAKLRARSRRIAREAGLAADMTKSRRAR